MSQRRVQFVPTSAVRPAIPDGLEPSTRPAFDFSLVASALPTELRDHSRPRGQAAHLKRNTTQQWHTSLGGLGGQLSAKRFSEIAIARRCQFLAVGVVSIDDCEPRCLRCRYQRTRPPLSERPCGRQAELATSLPDGHRRSLQRRRRHLTCPSRLSSRASCLFARENRRILVQGSQAASRRKSLHCAYNAADGTAATWKR